MDSQPRGTDWRSLLLLIFSLGSAFLVLSLAAVLMGMFILNERILSVSASLTNILGATTLTAIGLLLLPAGILSWQRLRGRKFASLRFPPLPSWGWAGLLLLWLVVLSLATVLYEAPGASWFVPVLHFMAVAIPVYILIRLGVNNIPLGSSQRVWAVFASGYSLSILVAIFLEVLLVLAGIVLVGIFVGLNPGIITNLEKLVNQVEGARDLESLLPILAPFINNPLTLVAALSFLSVFVPIIEELSKSIGVWLVADRLRSPAQGFALGFLSGAGFALAESLSATLTPDTTWGLSFMTRGLSSCMHMLATGLVGMGIAYFRLEKRPFKLAGLTLLAILLHAAWNAGAVLTVAGGLRAALAVPQVDIPGVILGLLGFSLLLALTTGMAGSLIFLNLRLRTHLPEPESSSEFPSPNGTLPELSSTPPNSGEPGLE